ncbi:MAG: hypothetical protein KDK70_11575 [Myxococcales bacterium]|nr:hypothetical protein [Myxococcales bacterium]
MSRPSSTSIVTITATVAVAAGVAMRPTPAPAGAAPAEIACTAKDTGQTLSGTIPRDTDDLELTLDDGKGHAHTWNDPEALVMTSELGDQLLLMHLPGRPQLTFWALPDTMKVKTARHEEHARFDAKAKVIGLGGDSTPRTLRLACTYDYSI